MFISNVFLSVYHVNAKSYISILLRVRHGRPLIDQINPGHYHNCHAVFGRVA